MRHVQILNKVMCIDLKKKKKKKKKDSEMEDLLRRSCHGGVVLSQTADTAGSGEWWVGTGQTAGCRGAFVMAPQLEQGRLLQGRST